MQTLFSREYINANMMGPNGVAGMAGLPVILMPFATVIPGNDNPRSRELVLLHEGDRLNE